MRDQDMTDTATLRETLQRHGFSETEAETYLAVVERGSATASTIADAAGVSTSYVYDICDRLASEGFLSVDDHRTPTRIQATDPAEAFGAMRSELDTLESAVTARYEQQNDDDNSFEVVKSRSTIVKRLEQYIDAAEDEIVLQLPSQRLPEVSENLRRAHDRGVLILLSLSAHDESSSLLPPSGPSSPLDLDGVATVARRGIAGAPSLLSIDQQRGVVSPATMLSWDHDETRAITFSQEAIAAVLVGSYLGNYWPIGETVAVARPPDLPLTSRMFRHAVLAATLHRRAGTELRAELYARPTGTDDAFETVVGEVVDVRQNLLDPPASDFGFENSLVVDTGDRRLSVGGIDAFLEDYETKQTTLRPA
ncbi:TrmB family transcriptional regulator [Halomicroarcula sp. GCM10025709]|uniref:TrmB family transcriptional regulator n=1 Tax=Haloarcula TaxID=2237 RepID=UPI0024C3B1EC|nr:TrmB family transcriptional regulator sugar-binding domain-containing protein [Halomicroarcula sp. YJ-61-S]